MIVDGREYSVELKQPQCREEKNIVLSPSFLKFVPLDV